MNDICKNKTSGHVKAYFIENGQERVVAEVPNRILGNTAFALADTYAGGARFKPVGMAFIYGTSIDASQVNEFVTYEGLQTAVGSSGTLQYVDFSYNANTRKSVDTRLQPDVAVFHAHSKSGADGDITGVVLLGGEDRLPLSIATFGSAISKGELELAIDWSITFKEGIS